MRYITEYKVKPVASNLAGFNINWSWFTWGIQGSLGCGGKFTVFQWVVLLIVSTVCMSIMFSWFCHHLLSYTHPATSWFMLFIFLSLSSHQRDQGCRSDGIVSRSLMPSPSLPVPLVALRPLSHLLSVTCIICSRLNELPLSALQLLSLLACIFLYLYSLMFAQLQCNECEW